MYINVDALAYVPSNIKIDTFDIVSCIEKLYPLQFKVAPPYKKKLSHPIKKLVPPTLKRWSTNKKMLYPLTRKRYQPSLQQTVENPQNEKVALPYTN